MYFYMFLLFIYITTNLKEIEEENMLKTNIKIFFKDYLLVANFISNLFYSIAYPTVHLTLMKHINERTISFNAIVVCLAGIIVPVIWNKKSDELYRKYGYLLTIEGVSYSLLTIAFIIGTIDSTLYYLIDTLLFAIIAKNTMCGGNRLRASKYKGKDREKFDNNSNIFSNVSSLIGFTASLLITIPTNVAFIILGIGVVSDNIFYYKAYMECVSQDN